MTPRPNSSVAGPVAGEKCEPGRHDEVDETLIAGRHAELAALAQAGTSLARVGSYDGEAVAAIG